MFNKPYNPKQRAFVISLILIGLAIVGFFGLRTARAFREFRGHRPGPPPPFAQQQVETDVSLIRDWMTIPFVAKMYRVPAHILFKAVDIPEHGNKEKNLKQLNDEYYPEAEGVVLEKIKAAILENQPPSTPTLPATPVTP
ncbi:MAG TPA: hypothetical protein VHP14_11320 [Anaerolineales bacterium]|nr:hypothetical protein [Anaerolineales bacterium]